MSGIVPSASLLSSSSSLCRSNLLGSSQIAPAQRVHTPSLIFCQCSSSSASSSSSPSLRTCKNCKKQYDPALNHPRACRYHTAHYGGETKRKFESVYTGGTMNTPDSGRVYQYWHCCGSEDPFNAGCTASPHCSYDD